MAPALSIGAAPGAAPPLHRFTVDEIHEMARAALFGDDTIAALALPAARIPVASTW